MARQAYAGLHWCKQYYHYSVKAWLEGDPAGPPPPRQRWQGRNVDWAQNLYNRDVLSMPDSWEYPWYAAWDLAFHMIPFCEVDPAFAKQQLILLLREWYMHPAGHLPAYEWAFDDVNPPVHAWAAWRVYKKTGPSGGRDTDFLKRAFTKLLLNFTWWVNRKDVEGKNLFAGGFLGLDNIGVFDRSKPLPTGGALTQADGTAWMAFYCTTMLSIALELAQIDSCYEDIASKFFEHFVAIVDAMNGIAGEGLWDETDGFYYDHLMLDGQSIPLRVRSMVGLIPALRRPGAPRRGGGPAARVQQADAVVPGEPAGAGGARLLPAPGGRAAPGRGCWPSLPASGCSGSSATSSTSRSSSRRTASAASPGSTCAHPYVLDGHQEWSVRYDPGDSTTGMFGGNSNWRGPVWFPINYLLIEALERYHHFYGDSFQVECPTGSGRMMTLRDVAHELSRRLLALFLPDAKGRRPAHGDEARYAVDPAFKKLVLFYEFFHGDTGQGLGASHQTGWTALAIEALRDVIDQRSGSRQRRAGRCGRRSGEAPRLGLEREPPAPHRAGIPARSPPRWPRPHRTPPPG